MLFVDFIPSRLITKLTQLGLSQSIWCWFNNFLTHCQNRPAPLPNSDAQYRCPTGKCVKLLLYMTYTCDCIQIHPTNMITEFAADTTVFGLILVSDMVGYKSKLKKKS